MFAILPTEMAARLRGEGAVFYDWNPPHAARTLLRDGEQLVRLVASWSTEADEVERFCRAIA